MGRRRDRSENQKEHITRDVFLSLLKAGAVLSVAMVAPNALKALKPFIEDKRGWEKYYPSSLNRHATKLWRKGFVDIRESKQGYTVMITEKGKTELLKYDIESLAIPKQDPWDGRWRLVVFDIPSGDETIRKIFREKLKTMGFFQMQKSVYVHPYPCSKQIRFLREVYQIPHAVKLAVVTSIENDDDLRAHFHI